MIAWIDWSPSCLYKVSLELGYSAENWSILSTNNNVLRLESFTIDVITKVVYLFFKPSFSCHYFYIWLIFLLNLSIIFTKIIRLEFIQSLYWWRHNLYQMKEDLLLYFLPRVKPVFHNVQWQPFCFHYCFPFHCLRKTAVSLFFLSTYTLSLCFHSLPSLFLWYHSFSSLVIPAIETVQAVTLTEANIDMSSFSSSLQKRNKVSPFHPSTRHNALVFPYQ